MELDSLAGLPAHPLLVHLPVVLIPLTAVVAVLAVLITRWRRVLAPAAAVMAVVGALGAVLAAGGGESLEERLAGADMTLVHRHAEWGEGLRTIAVGMAVACVVFAVASWPGLLRRRPESAILRVLGTRAVRAGIIVAVLAGVVLGAVWVIGTGHSGAEAVWSQQAAASAQAVPDPGIRVRIGP